MVDEILNHYENIFQKCLDDVGKFLWHHINLKLQDSKQYTNDQACS